MDYILDHKSKSFFFFSLFIFSIYTLFYLIKFSSIIIKRKDENEFYRELYYEIKDDFLIWFIFPFSLYGSFITFWFIYYTNKRIENYENNKIKNNKIKLFLEEKYLEEKINKEISILTKID